jgi:hypothetical protein
MVRVEELSIQGCAEASDVRAWLGWLTAQLRHLADQKWLLAALSGSELAKPIEFAQSCGLAILLVLIV